MREFLGRCLKAGVGFVLLWILLFVWSSCGLRRAPGKEMAPTISNDKLVWLIYEDMSPDELERGDVVLFEHPVPGLAVQTLFTGRVMARPGERVKMEKGTCYVNGQAVREDYVSGAARTDETLEEIIVPANCVFILMDDRKWGARADSRAHGPIGVGALIARVRL